MRTKERVHTQIISAIALLLALAAPLAALDRPINKEELAREMAAMRLSRIGAQDVENGSDNIEFVIDDDSEFTIGTREGDPRLDSDDDKKLLFGHPFPWSSDTMIEIDGVRTLLSLGTKGPITSDGTTSSMAITMPNGIVVTQTLGVTNSRGTSLPGAVRIAFRVTNTGVASRAIRLRTQLDTMLGANDGAPFRLPDFDPITHDREFDNHAATPGVPDLPSTALVFDDLGNPTIAAEFGFTPVGYPEPDRVVFGHWGTSYQDWDYVTNPARQLTDSSVIVWWGYDAGGAYDTTYTLAPGASEDFAIDYGIGNSCTFLPGAPLSMIVCAPLELEGVVVGNTFRYSPDPAIVTAFLSNTSGVALTGATARLNMTPGLQLLTGQDASRDVETTIGSGVIGVDEAVQVNWSLLTTARILGVRHYSMSVDAVGGRRVLSRAVRIKPIPYAVYGQATDSQGNPIVGAALTIYRGDNVIGALTTQADGTYALGNLPPGPYRVRLQAPGQAESFFTAYAAAPDGSGATGNPTAFAEAADAFRVRAYPNPVRDGPIRIAFSTTGQTSAEVKIFDTAGRSITTLSVSAPGAGWHEVEWDAASAANGVYFYQVEAGGERKSGRFAVLKRRP